jgi:hypothetical protein
MPKWTHALLVPLLALALLCAIAPLGAAAAPPQSKASCCTVPAAKGENERCRKEMPRSTPERQCCATCVTALAMVAGLTPSALVPPGHDRIFENFTEGNRERSERPPVPPPRA